MLMVASPVFGSILRFDACHSLLVGYARKFALIVVQLVCQLGETVLGPARVGAIGAAGPIGTAMTGPCFSQGNSGLRKQFIVARQLSSITE